MLQLAFELTNRCDIACLHCLRDKFDERDDLPKDFILRVLDEAEQLGVQIVSFTGGEPTLHPDYIELIDQLASRGIRWITVTNGHNTELFQKVFSCRKRTKALQTLAISLDGADEESHDKIRGKGSFRKIMRTVSTIVPMGANVRFQMVLSTLNFDQMEEFILLSSRMGLKSAFFAYMQPTQKNVASGLMLSPSDHRRAQIRIARLTKMFSIEVGNTFGFYHKAPLVKCSILNNNAMNVDYKGNMVFCCQISNFGDITYVPDRKEIIADLNKDSLLEGYKAMLDRINVYNKTKADEVARGEVKGLDLFPCHYCMKKFGKLDWLQDEKYKNNNKLNGWQDNDADLPKTLVESAEILETDETDPKKPFGSLMPYY